MTELDAVRAYRERLLDLVVNRSDVRMDGAVQYVPRGKETLEIFDAAIAALENRIRSLESNLAKCEQQKRGLATAAQTGMVAANRVIELEAELERLKVCGSCEHCNPKGPWCREAGNLWNFEAAEAGWDWLLTDGSIDDRVGLHFKCHFTPSRWTEAAP